METLRDCGDIMRLLETWHGVQSGSRRKAEFEWVGMVGVGLGRRTDIADTVGVGRECVLSLLGAGTGWGPSLLRTGKRSR